MAAAFALGIAGAATRLVGLRQLPIFGDEAMFLHVATLVRSDPSRNLWLPLGIPYAPLHPWLLALSLSLDADPVRAGRLLSVLCGMLLAPALAWTVWRAGSLLSDRVRGEVAGVIAAALVVTSPFFALSERLARVEALYALEVTLAAGLALEVAARARRGAKVGAAAVGLGVLMGFTMLTRQAVSYPLWLLSPVAFAIVPGERSPSSLRRFGTALAVAAAVASALWIPMLVAPGWPSLATRVFFLAEARPSPGAAERIRVLLQNAALAGESFWTYLTPPVLAASVGGALGLAGRGRRRLVAYLAGWGFLLLAPAALFARDYFPRYALPAALPLLAVAAFGLAALWTRAKVETVALVVAIAAWGVVDIWHGERDWHKWRLLREDRTQYVSGWSAGTASERAASFLESRARESPIVAIVPHVSGNPSDAVWLLLGGVKNVRLFYAEDFLRLPALRVRGDVWTGAPAAEMDPDRPVYFVSQDPAFLGREGWTAAREVILPRNPGARPVARFENPPNSEGEVESAVEIYRLR